MFVACAEDINNKKPKCTLFKRITDKYQRHKFDISFITLLLSLVLFIFGCVFTQPYILLFSAFFLWLHNTVYSLFDFRRRFLHFLFQIVLFVFLLGRPLISVFHFENMVALQIKYGATRDSVALALKLIYVSMLCILLVGYFLTRIEIKRAKKTPVAPSKGFLAGFRRQFALLEQKQSDNPITVTENDLIPKTVFIPAMLQKLRFVALAIVGVSLVAQLILSAEKLLYIFQHSYVDYYANFSSQAPYLIYVISTFFVYGVYIYLSTLPCKRNAFILLFIYLSAELPDFIGGERGGFVLRILFCLFYYLLRDALYDSEKWIGKWEKRLMLLGSILGTLVLGVMNYTREGTALPTFNPLAIMEDLIFKQGVSFSWLSAGLAKLTALYSQGVESYTFAGVIDYLSHNRIAQLLFDASPLSGTNSVQMITQSNSMAHHLSYILLGKEYFAGHGTGSCYLLELFTDFGWLGIVVFSAILGSFFHSQLKITDKGIFALLFTFCTLEGILYLPRAEALGGLEFMWRIPFWCTVCVWLFGSVCLGTLEKKVKKYT